MNDTRSVTHDVAISAERAAESIRELNYAASQIRDSSEMYEVLGGLLAMAEQLPASCTQMRVWLEREAENGRLRARGGPFLSEAPSAVKMANEWLSRAAGLAEQLRQALSYAHAAVAGLSHTGAVYQPELEPLLIDMCPTVPGGFAAGPAPT